MIIETEKLMNFSNFFKYVMVEVGKILTVLEV